MTRAGPEWAYKVVKESGIGLLGSVAGTALNYVLLMTVARTLSPAEYGTFALAQSVTTVALIAALFGTPRALDRFIPLFVAGGDLGRARTLIAVVFRIGLITGAVATVVLVLGSDLIAGFVSKQPGLAPVLRLTALSLPMLVLIELVVSSFVGFKELRYRVYTQQLALPVIRIALVAVAFALGYRLFGWLAVYLISLMLVSGLALAFFIKLIRPLLRRRSASPVSLSRIVSYSWPLTINNIVLVFFGQVAVFFLGRFRPLAEVGVFRIYVYVVLIMVMVRTSFTSIYKPVASGMISTGAHQELAEAYARVAKWLFLINGALFLLIALFGGRVLGTVLGSRYLVAPAALVVLAAGRLLVSSLGPQGMTLEAFGHTRLSMVNSLAMVGTNVALCSVLIPTLGISGAAIAASVSASVGGLAGFVEVLALHRLHPFRVGFLRGLCVLIGVGLLIRFASLRFPGAGVTGLVAWLAATLALYSLGLFLIGALDAADRAVLVRVRERILRRR